jgi:hypothetical protein
MRLNILRGAALVGLSFPNGYDGEGKIAGCTAYTYQPWWAVIAKDGTLQRTGFGPSGEEELTSTIRALAGR